MIHGSKLSASNPISSKPNFRQVEYSQVSKSQSGPGAHQGTSSRDLLMGQINNGELWMALGQVYERRREYTQAAASFRHGSELDPVDSDVAFAWARASLSAGDYPEAKTAINQLRSIDPLRVGPQLLEHPVMIEGRKAEEVSKTKEKPIVKVQVGPRTSGIIPQKPNPNTVPAQDATQNAAPRQV